MTFSIVARSEDGQSWGVAVASRFLAVGAVCPAAVAGIGALVTQAEANVGYKGLGLSMLEEGATAEVALQRMIEDDEGRDYRQVGMVDVEGGVANYTGGGCLDWAGAVSGPGYSIQGNLLAGPDVVESMQKAFEASAHETSLARRLLAALRAGDEAGGDIRGRQAASLFVVREAAGYGGGDDVDVDLRVDDHPDPCAELTRLLSLQELYLTPSSEEEKVPVDDVLREELEERAQALGHADFYSWVGFANFELRVGDDWVDERVLAILRAPH
jgi:uncharacterized Ntn-hydrolase superfamily protein